MTKKIIL